MNIATTKDREKRLNLSSAEDSVQRVAVSFSDTDLDALRAHLGQGLSGFARQGDIVELHKRIGEKFQKLPTELNVLHEQSKASLHSRFETFEASLNSLEGALRIELAPMLQAAVSEEIRRTSTSRRRWGRGLFFGLTAVAAGVAIGVVYHAEISEFAFSLSAYFR